jgi:hypothetical protein
MRSPLFIAAALAAGLLAAPAAQADGARRYEVTVTNLTRGQQFTPILAASHDASVRMFELGQPASAPLATLAEEGNTAPLAAWFSAMPGTAAVVAGSGLTNPGASTTLHLETRGAAMRLSVAAMLIPTNDAFFAANGIELPRGSQPLVMLVPAYDSGSERNDETCAAIPGPMFAECGGSGGGARVGGGEGFVHIHAGMHGIGSFTPAQRDWRNPVARITVRRVQ